MLRNGFDPGGFKVLQNIRQYAAGANAERIGVDPAFAHHFLGKVDILRAVGYGFDSA